LADLKKGAIGNPEKMREYEKVMLMSQDIVNCRLRKIVSLASSPEQTNHILKDLAQEERILYERLHSIIDEWKSKMLKVTDET
jgi:DNA replication initiation complex subunit (GINS family)